LMETVFDVSMRSLRIGRPLRWDCLCRDPRG
jgi:hypothetical protein